MEPDYIMFLIERGNSHVFTYALERENAKRNARAWLGGDLDDYIVTPLTEPGDRIHFNLTLAV